MKNHDDPHIDEAIILALKPAPQTDVQLDDNPPELVDGNDRETDDAFWAGRNLAMRRSARWAA